MAGELLGEGFVEIKPKLDAFKAELNKNAKKAIEKGIEDPANKAEDAVEDLVKAAKKLGDAKPGTGFDKVTDSLSKAVKEANKLANVDVSAEAKKAVLQSRLLAAAQNAAQKAAEEFADSEDEVRAAVKKATADARKLGKAIEASAVDAADFETAMVAATKNLRIAAGESDEVAEGMEGAAQAAADFGRAADKVDLKITAEQAESLRKSLVDPRIRRSLTSTAEAADDVSDGLLDSIRNNKDFVRGLDKAKDAARQITKRMKGVGDETDRVGDEAKTAARRIDKAEDQTQQWEKAARGVRAAVAGIVAGLGAREIVQGLKESTSAALDFQGGLNEVFTLIPGVSDLVRGELTDGVREVAREFGQLPEDAVPALYNALSAGVPPDNVLTFLEDASRLAVGGVTDLNSGVNVLTTVVNSYSSQLDENGLALLDSAKASDILFTTVRLGKTTIDELNASLGQVLPTAAATGLSFEDVGAAMAVLTANGLSTPRATTALNASLVELNKSGTTANKLFEQVAGQTFPDFISSGGSLSEGLGILREGADDLGVSLIDAFPIESGKGILALTNNLDSLESATDEFGDTLGATDDAFAEIFEGDAFAVQQAQAAFADLKIEIGNALLPTVAAVAAVFVDLYKGFLENGFEGFLDELREIAPATTAIIEKILELTDTIAEFFSGLGLGDSLEGLFGEDFSPVDGIIAALAGGAALLGAAIIGFLGPAVLSSFAAVFGGGAAVIGTILGGLGTVIAGAFGGIAGIVGGLGGVFGGLSTIIGGFFGLFTGGGLAGFSGSLTSIIGGLRTLFTVINPVFLIGSLLIGAFAKLTKENEGFRDSVKGLLPPIIAVGQAIIAQLIPFFNTLKDVLFEQLIPAFEPVVLVIVEQLIPALTQLWQSIVDNILPILLELATFFFENILPVLAQVVAFILEKLIVSMALMAVFIAEEVLPRIAELWVWFKDNIIPILIEVAAWIVGTLIPAFQSFAGWVTDSLIPVLVSMYGWFAENILPILVGLAAIVTTILIPALVAIATAVIDTVVPKLTTLYNFFVDNILPVIADVVTAVTDNLTPVWDILATAIGLGADAFDVFKTSVETALGFVQSMIDAVLSLKDIDLGSVISGAVGFLPGLANGGIITQATQAIVGEDGPEVVIPLSGQRRERLFELAKASGLDQIILNNFGSVEAAPTTNGQFEGLSRALESRSVQTTQQAPSASAGATLSEQAMPAQRIFNIEANGLTMEEVVAEIEAQADAELRSEEVGV